MEYTRDIAQKLNHTYGNTLKVPQLMLSPADASIIGSDGRKMSTSYGNAVPQFADSNALRSWTVS